MFGSMGLYPIYCTLYGMQPQIKYHRTLAHSQLATYMHVYHGMTIEHTHMIASYVHSYILRDMAT